MFNSGAAANEFGRLWKTHYTCIKGTKSNADQVTYYGRIANRKLLLAAIERSKDSVFLYDKTPIKHCVDQEKEPFLLEFSLIDGGRQGYEMQIGCVEVVIRPGSLDIDANGYSFGEIVVANKSNFDISVQGGCFAQRSPRAVRAEREQKLFFVERESLFVGRGWRRGGYFDLKARETKTFSLHVIDVDREMVRLNQLIWNNDCYVDNVKSQKQ